MPETIATERLLLRRPVMADAPAIAGALAEWGVIRWLALPPWPYVQAYAECWLSSAHERPWSFAITHQGRFAGSIGISGHLGYWLTRDAWGKGFATEAATALLDAWFATGQGDHLVSGYFDGNAASRRVLRKLGFAETGQGLEFCRPRGAEVVHVNMALPRAVWQARRAAA